MKRLLSFFFGSFLLSGCSMEELDCLESIDGDWEISSVNVRSKTFKRAEPLINDVFKPGANWAFDHSQEQVSVTDASGKGWKGGLAHESNWLYYGTEVLMPMDELSVKLQANEGSAQQSLDLTEFTSFKNSISFVSDYPKYYLEVELIRRK